MGVLQEKGFSASQKSQPQRYILSSSIWGITCLVCPKGCLISSTPISPASLPATVSLELSLALPKLANRLQTRLTKEVSEEQISGEF